jgi:hypothetical protein
MRAASHDRVIHVNPLPACHVLVCTPCFGGQVSALYVRSLLQLKDACQRADGVTIDVKMLTGDALIPRARQELLGVFVDDARATHLLFVDADIGFEPDAVFRLLAFDADVVAGIYPAKEIDWQRVAALAKTGCPQLPSAALPYVIAADDPQNIVTVKGFAKVRAAGTGFMLIRRRALVDMIARYPELRYSPASPTKTMPPIRHALFNCIVDAKTGTFLSEDYSFCRRWTDIGGEIWVDLQSRLTHVGAYAFEGDVASLFSPAKD